MAKRAHISLQTKLACALACLLPQDQRDDLRRTRATPQKVLSMFEWDHIHLFALGGDDHWSNLDPKIKAEHREKSRKDTGIVAKINRIVKKEADHAIAMRAQAPLVDVLIAAADATNHRSKWPKGRKIASRPFPKRRS